MPVTVVVGGQYGGEGKGKVAHFLAQEMNARVAVRVGGTNSGHTVVDPSGQPIILRQLPTPSILPDVICVLGAGSYINPDILFDEIKRTGLSNDRLFIDPNAMIISEKDQREEKGSDLRSSIGSTLSGTGAAVIRRIRRGRTVKLAKDEECLRQYIKPAVEFLRDNLLDHERVIIEGTQGYGLSLLHSPYYPYATSRDTTAATFVAEAGISPLDVDDIALVIRAFPIRVGGNSGPLKHETNWHIISEDSGSQESLIELTSVSKSVRRIARFDDELVRQAIKVNRPTRIILNHLDYVDFQGRIKNNVTEKTREFIRNIEYSLNTPIHYVGLGPSSLMKYIIEEVRVYG